MDRGAHVAGALIKRAMGLAVPASYVIVEEGGLEGSASLGEDNGQSGETVPCFAWVVDKA